MSFTVLDKFFPADLTSIIIVYTGYPFLEEVRNRKMIMYENMTQVSLSGKYTQIVLVVLKLINKTTYVHNRLFHNDPRSPHMERMVTTTQYS